MAIFILQSIAVRKMLETVAILLKFLKKVLYRRVVVKKLIDQNERIPNLEHFCQISWLYHKVDNFVRKMMLVATLLEIGLVAEYF